MKTIITAWPIDKAFQENLGIYSTGECEPGSVGPILHALIEAGYTELNSFVEEKSNTPGKTCPQLTIHCQAGPVLMDKIRDSHNAKLQAMDTRKA